MEMFGTQKIKSEWGVDGEYFWDIREDLEMEQWTKQIIK